MKYLYRLCFVVCHFSWCDPDADVCRGAAVYREEVSQVLEAVDLCKPCFVHALLSPVTKTLLVSVLVSIPHELPLSLFVRSCSFLLCLQLDICKACAANRPFTNGNESVMVVEGFAHDAAPTRY